MFTRFQVIQFLRSLSFTTLVSLNLVAFAAEPLTLQPLVRTRPVGDSNSAANFDGLASFRQDRQPSRSETQPTPRRGYEELSSPFFAPNPQPVGGASDVPVKAPPPRVSTSDETITRRYSDPRFLRSLQGLNEQTGERFYREVSQLIDTRHLRPVDYTERTQQGLRNLQLAIKNEAFLRANQLQPTSKAVREFQAELQGLLNEVRVGTVEEAVQVLRLVSRFAQKSVGLPSRTVAMEFAQGAITTQDLYSAYLPPEKNGGPSVGLNENLVGIGVEIDSVPEGLRILKTLSGGPAAEATLKANDLIIAVDGRSLAGMPLSTAADFISGPAGSAVQLSLKRGEMPGSITLTRRAVQVKSVSEVRMETGTEKVGFIKLDVFGEKTAAELDAALWSLHQQGMESLILDLRGNPGGLLTTAIEVSDRFLPEGTIVSTRGRTAADNSTETAKRPQTWRVPLTVLVDHNSASASELFAAAMQDHGRAVIVGERSYGKGTVQTAFPLQTIPGALKLTTAKFYSPNGREIAGSGVLPDITARTVAKNPAVPSDETDAPFQAALRVASQQATGATVNALTRTPAVSRQRNQPAA